MSSIFNVQPLTGTRLPPDTQVYWGHFPLPRHHYICLSSQGTYTGWLIWWNLEPIAPKLSLDIYRCLCYLHHNFCQPTDFSYSGEASVYLTRSPICVLCPSPQVCYGKNIGKMADKFARLVWCGYIDLLPTCYKIGCHNTPPNRAKLVCEADLQSSRLVVFKWCLWNFL